MVASKTRVKVPGKAILFGEHAVVYGVPAIAFPVARSLELELEARGDLWRLEAPCWELELDASAMNGPAAKVAAAVERAFEVTPGCHRGLLLRLNTDIPRSAGLGSSAAMAVALVKGLAGMNGEELEPSELLARAGQVEKVFHGNPSGVDHSVVALEKPIYFRAETGERRDISLQHRLSFVIGIVGNHGGTIGRVQALSERRARYESLYRGLFAQVELVVEEGLEALTTGDHAYLGELMNVNQGLLNALGVSSPELERCAHALRHGGALGVKLSGAGGGGALLALAQSNEKQLQQIFSSCGYESFVSYIETHHPSSQRENNRRSEERSHEPKAWKEPADNVR